MKSETEILEEYLQDDKFYQGLSYPEKLLYKTQVIDTAAFGLYELKARLSELVAAAKRVINKVR